jgi:hypothetical protein
LEIVKKWRHGDFIEYGWEKVQQRGQYCNGTKHAKQHKNAGQNACPGHGMTCLIMPFDVTQGDQPINEGCGADQSTGGRTEKAGEWDRNECAAAEDQQTEDSQYETDNGMSVCGLRDGGLFVGGHKELVILQIK